MKLEKLEQKLWQAARSEPASDAVPYGFEQRVMARVREACGVDRWLSWSQALWRAAFACLGLSLLCGALTLWVRPSDPIAKADLSEALETAVFASLDQTETAW